MKHKIKQVHFVRKGGAAMSREQGPAMLYMAGCERPRMALPADCDAGAKRA